MTPNDYLQIASVILAGVTTLTPQVIQLINAFALLFHHAQPDQKVAVMRAISDHAGTPGSAEEILKAAKDANTKSASVVGGIGV